MPSISKIKEVTLIRLQNYPEICARYIAGDPTVTAHIDSFMHVIAELSRDVEVSELEPFVKSRDATILADASNKGILPLALPCQYNIEIRNSSKTSVVLQANRVFQDGRGRKWRLLQYVEGLEGQTVTALAEQSEIRTVRYIATITEPFHQYKLTIQDGLSLVSLSIKDQDGNPYSVIPRWMNSAKGEKHYILKTNSSREIILEFGDSERYGSTLEANTELTIEVVETDGDIDTTNLKEASLLEVLTSTEAKLAMRFSDSGLVRMGANPLSIDQMRLLASYPTHDDNAVFLSNFDFLVRKNFMARVNFSNVWNESIHEKYFGANIDNINHLFVSFLPKHKAEYEEIKQDIARLIAKADSLYSGDNVVFIPTADRIFQIQIHATLSPIHDPETVKDQIRSLLTSTFGKGKVQTSYHVSNGFNLQEVSKLINQNIVAFQDRQSDFKIYTEDLTENPVLPYELLYVDASGIQFEVTRSSSIGGGLWSVY